jgi:acyl-CoA dehydrogenase
MFTLFLVLTTIGLAWLLAYFSVPLKIWSVGLLLLTGSAAYFNYLGWSAWVILPLVFSALMILNVPLIRQKLITGFVFNWFIKVLPPMSNTERSAIEAGTTWWETDLYCGSPKWSKLFSLPPASLSDEETKFINDKVVPLCEMLDDWEICHEKSNLPDKIWQYLRENKFFSIIIPKQYGGLGFSAFAHSSIVTKLSTKSIAAAVTTMVPNSLGPAELLLAYGTKEQKNHYLPRLASGKEIPCFALTGSEAGSDAGSIPDTGIVCYGQHEGKKVLGINLNFDKRYITLAPVATVMGLAFKLFDPEKLLGQEESLGITVCLIPTNHPGVEIGKRHFPLNVAFLNGPIKGKDVFVPIDWIIGGSPMVGQGWRMLMECLSAGRGISLPALGTGSGLLSYTMSGAYAAIRKQFNTPIGSFEGVQEPMAQIAGSTLKLEATRHLTALGVDMVHKPSVASAIAKYHMTEMARQAISDSMDIHGGKGIMLGPLNYLGRIYQSIPISITVEGANILTRSLMIFGQGAIRCHPYIKLEMDAVALNKTDPKQALKQFDSLLIKHIGFFASNKARCLARALTGGRIVLKVPDVHKQYLQKLSWLSSGLAFCSEFSMMILGGNLKRKERISARLGDILSQLYLASSVLKYANERPADEALYSLTDWCLQDILFKTQEAYYGLFENFPNRIVANIMRFMVFPFGRRFKKPSDEFDQQIAQDMLESTKLRDEFTQVCYIGTSIQDPTGLVEIAFQKLQVVQPLLDKISDGIKNQIVPKDALLDMQINAALEASIINNQEYQSLLEYDALRQKVISVDEFSQKTQLGSESPWSQKQVTIQVG